MVTAIIILFIIGAIVGVFAWHHDTKGETGLFGDLFLGGLGGGIGCLFEVLPTLIIIAVIMYCCS